MRFGIPDITAASAGDRAAFPAQSSVLDEQALMLRVLPLYDLAEPRRSCRFLTRGDSDVYQIATHARYFYLKIRRPPITKARCEAEARFVADLASRGLPVVRPIPLKRGRGYAAEVRAAEGMRPVLMFEAAPPPVAGALDAQQSRQFGELLGLIHEAAGQRPRDPELREYDIDSVRTAVADVIAATAAREDDQQTLLAAADLVTRALAQLANSSSDVGPIHGDLAPSNLRISAAGRLTLFDFGAAHHSWRTLELLDARRRHWPDAAPGWSEFLAGYRSVRAIPWGVDELPATDDLRRKLQTMGYVCNALTLRLGITCLDEQQIGQQIAEVREMLAAIGDDSARIRARDS